MTVTSRKIASNTIWYMTALTLQKVISFVYFTLLARYLGPDDTGKYFFAASFVLIFAVFADLGMSAIATREIAKLEKRGEQLFNQIVSLKLLTSVLIAIALASITPLIVHDPVTLMLVAVAGLAMILDGFTLIFYSGIRGKQNLGYESFATLVHQAIILVVGFYLIMEKYPVEILAGALVAGSLFNFTYSFWVAHSKLGLKLQWYWNKQELHHLWRLILPFALAAIFTRLYAYADSVMLKLMQGSTEVGYYSVAYKVTFAFQFIPLAFIAALYPAFSYYWHHDKDKLNSVFISSLQYLLLVAIPISFGLIASAPYIIPHIYTEAFGPSIRPLQLLIINLPFLFLNFPLGSLLNAINKQKVQTIILTCGLVWNLAANFLLIPLWGASGAAVASSSSSILVLVISLMVVNRYMDYQRQALLMLSSKTIASGVVMACLVYFLSPFVNPYLTIILGGLTYILLIWLFGLLRLTDIRLLLSSFKREKA